MSRDDDSFSDVEWVARATHRVSSLDGKLAAAPSDRRRHERYNLRLAAICRFADGSEQHVMVVDASEGGFGLDRNLGVGVDTEFQITMAEAGTFPCRLAWFDDARCGVALLQTSDVFADDAIADLAKTLK